MIYLYSEYHTAIKKVRERKEDSYIQVRSYLQAILSNGKTRCRTTIGGQGDMMVNFMCHLARLYCPAVWSEPSLNVTVEIFCRCVTLYYVKEHHLNS
jgi:hypothetical protein